MKLTLNVDENIIEEAKKYAKSNDTSVSKIVENYLSSIVRKKNVKDIEVSPLVESLTGVIPEVDDSGYGDYLQEKYQ